MTDFKQEDVKQASPLNNYDPTINIAIIGAVSAGKSTLMNALFVQQYSDAKIKRTTAIPQVYVETDKTNFTEEDAIKIKEQNTKINKEMMDATTKGIELKEIHELYHPVPKVYDTFDLPKGTYLSIYDLPGLNDSMTKNVYYKYVKENFYKFNIVIFVVDINSALNTSDEIDILNLILENIKINKEKFGYNTNLIVLVNKCDELIEIGGIMVPQDQEFLEMYEQIKTIISTRVNAIMPSINKSIICASCEDGYIYRMYKKNPKTKIDIKYVNKLGANELGQKVWNKKKWSEEEKRKEIAKILKEEDFNCDERIEQCGFTKFKEVLKKYLTTQNQCAFLTDHIDYALSELINSVASSSNQSLNYIIDSINYYNESLIKIYKRYKKNNEQEIIKKYASQFIKNYNKNQLQYINQILKIFDITFKNYDLHIKKNIEHIENTLCNYLTEELFKNQTFHKIIEICDEFEKNKYDSFELIKLIPTHNFVKSSSDIHNAFVAFNRENFILNTPTIDHYLKLFEAQNVLIAIIIKLINVFNLEHKDVLDLICNNLIALYEYNYNNRELKYFHSIISYGLKNYLIESSNPYKLTINMLIDFFGINEDKNNIKEYYNFLNKCQKAKEINNSKTIDEFLIEILEIYYPNDIVHINNIIKASIKNKAKKSKNVKIDVINDNLFEDDSVDIDLLDNDTLAISSPTSIVSYSKNKKNNTYK
jgi:predicted GTPase